MSQMADAARRSRRPMAGSRQRRINDILGLVLVGASALAPVALGANNPLSWSVNATLVGLSGLVYLVILAMRNEQPRVGLGQYGAEAALWLALIGFLIAQTVPLDLFGLAASVKDTEGNTYLVNQLSLAPDATALMALRLSGYGLFLYLCLQVAANRDRALRLAELMLLVFAGHALYGLLALAFLDDALLIFEKWAYQGVATGTFVNRNSFATFLAIGLVLGVALTLRSLVRTRSETGQRLPRQDERLARTSILGVATIIILAALLATQSRMGLFAGLAGAATIIALAAFKLGDTRWRTSLLVCAGGGAVFAIVLLGFGSGTIERLGSVESAADVRLELYSQVQAMIGQNWLWGTGGGSFEIAYPLFHRWPVSPDLVWDKAHNTYLALWSELGIFAGTIPLLVLALLAMRMIFLIIGRSEDWWLPLAALAGLVVVAIHSLVDFSMEIQGVVFPLLLVLALGLDTRSRERTAAGAAQGDKAR